MLHGNPFSQSPDERAFETPARRDALKRLTEGLGSREPFVLVTGEPGTGKTALIHAAIAAWGASADVAFVANPALTRLELLEEIARRFRIEPPQGASKPQLLASLERALSPDQDRTGVVVIDDAHELDPELLEELRLLANTMSKAGCRIEFLLVGLPALESRLADPALESLRQRIATHCRLVPMTNMETRRHLHERVSAAGGSGQSLFPRDTCREVFKRTRGVPRAVDVLAAEAWRRARAAKSRTVTVSHVRAAAEALPAGEPSAAAPAKAAPTKAAAPSAPDGNGAAASAPAPTPPAPEPPPAAPPRNRRKRTEVAASRDSKKPPQNASSASQQAPPAPSEMAPPSPSEPTPASPSEQHSEVSPSRDTERTRAAAPAPESSASTTSDETIDETAHETPQVAPAGKDDTRVDEWISRFIDPDEPRFGSLLMAATADMTRSREIDVPAERRVTSEAAPDELPMSFAERRAKPGKAARPRGRPRLRAAAWTTPAAIALVIMTAAAVIVLVTREPKDARESGVPQSVASSAAPAPQEGETPAIAADPAIDESAVDPGAPTGVADSPTPTHDAETHRDRAVEPTTVGTEAQAPGAGADAQPTAHEPASSQRFSLVVGSYVSPYRAESERDMLASASGLDAWVVEATRDDATVYQVVLGVYSTEERARQSAAVLTERGLITESNVVPLPPRSQRR